MLINTTQEGGKMEKERQKQPTLDDLFRGEHDVEDRELAETLHGRVSLTKDLDKVFFAETQASINTRLVLAGLARHALQRKGLIKEEGVAKDPDWYARQLQEKPKTVSESLSRLKRQNIFVKNEKGYQIPAWGVRKAIEFLRKS